MGLDMYLFKIKRIHVVDMMDLNPETLIVENPSLYEQLAPYVLERGKYFRYNTHHDEVAHWRKANHIHNWFVINVQNGADDCGNYAVSIDNLADLKTVCDTALHFKERASIILPTCEGFFFGSTDYDEGYFEDIKYTMDVCDKILQTTNFNEDLIFYTSSW